MTVGILCIGRQFIKNKRKLFSVLTITFTPIIVCAFVFFRASSHYLSRIKRPTRKITITNVLVTNTSPLTLSLNAKSFYMAEIWFDQVYVKDRNQTTVASIIGKEVEIQEPNSSPYWTFQFVARLPPASEKTLTLNFNTTLPSGEYSVRLHSYRQDTFTTLYFITP